MDITDLTKGDENKKKKTAAKEKPVEKEEKTEEKSAEKRKVVEGASMDQTKPKSAKLEPIDETSDGARAQNVD